MKVWMVMLMFMPFLLLAGPDFKHPGVLVAGLLFVIWVLSDLNRLEKIRGNKQ